MRGKNSIKNMIASLFSNATTIIVGFIAQTIFIKILGTEYLGLNSLFTNIISMLGIAELGIGSAIIYNLYKPLAENDKKTIKSLMSFYKRSYHIIAIIITLIGLIIIPLLKYIVNFETVTVNVNLYIIYILFLFETVISYFLSYKRSILFADQKNYIINIIHIGYTIVVNICQLIILYLTHNYYLYLIIRIIMRVVENIIITLIVNEKYNYLNKGKSEVLAKNVEKDIVIKVKALFFHKIGSFVVMGTDNIIISKYLGIITVGLYSNYFLIINAVQTIFSQIIGATTASVGNMLVTEKKEKCFEIFDKIRFINFWISTVSSVCLLLIMEPFITIWIGEKYLLSSAVLIVLVINFFQKSMRSVYAAFKEAAGIYYEDRFAPIIESIFNIVFSIIFVKYFGLAGVFMGTLVSGLILWCYSYPKCVYKKLFDRKQLVYFKETLTYIILFSLIIISTYYLSNLLIIKNIWYRFFANTLLAVIVPNLILILIFNRTDNYKYVLKKLLHIKK